MANLNAAAALANANAQIGKTITPQGMCLNFVWRMYGSVPSIGDAVGHLDTAWNSWGSVKNKHLGDRNVPAGYFAMLGPSPTRTDKNKNAGDIIISRGDGTFVCTDASGARVGVMTLAARERQTARPFVGWGEDLGNHTIIGAAQSSLLPPSTAEETDMAVRLIRNNTTGDKEYGSICAFCVETGMWIPMPNSGYVDAWKNAYKISVEDTPANWFGYWKQMTWQSRSDSGKNHADILLATGVSGFNGTQTVSARLAGIDDKADDLDANAVKKIVDALPASSGGSAPVAAEVDYNKLAAALVPLLVPAVTKGVNDDAAKRMQA